MRFAIFPIHLSKVLRLPRESDARSYEVLHLSRKIISANLKIWCSKMQPLSGNQRPDLLTALMNMSLVLRLPRKMDLRRSSSNVTHLPSFFEMLQNPHVLLTVDKVHNPLRLPRETTSERPKVVRACWCFKHLTWKCASRHNSVDFFDISTSKSGLNPSVFYAFGLEMCFAPQRRALFRHLNFQKWSEPVSFYFWLGNVLRATTLCTFSISQLPKVVWTRQFFTLLTWKCASRHNGVHFFDISTSKSWGGLYILTWKCASRHTGVHFFISHLASWLRTRRFSEPTFRPSGATNHWKNTVFRGFPTFSRTCIFCLLTLSLLFLIFFLLLFFSDPSHLCFSSVHIVGGLTSKLPSIMAYWIDTILIPIYIYVFMGLYICIHI